ncbi:hypothetical protein N7468_002803 [Penicillium chermesinum]|uniref:Uncharacterized protein n=1 Tax=Penicillium chermesinum TaxID=63820 RepID=A0A9W9PJ96_9EURO|nr:uncharacterized protein N7468_002803 [Penicillium chermesinum]KAJ5247820.1 hypothetical protein N7468_002803 [Penicillium chermesinum]KAJ6151581.1 hypothetical protein N7470_007178 [Penicillium chermesinum]
MSSELATAHGDFGTSEDEDVLKTPGAAEYVSRYKGPLFDGFQDERPKTWRNFCSSKWQIDR